MSNEKYVQSYNDYGGPKFLARGPALHLLEAHRTGQAEVKVSARWGLRVVLYFDFDRHESGNLEHVRRLAEIVRGRFPSMPEFVIDDRGGSGWLVLDPSGLTPEEYNRLVTRIENYFASLARSLGLDIQYVEVMGRVYEHTFGGGRLLSVKAGDMMKCPPDESFLEQVAIPADVFLGPEFDEVPVINPAPAATPSGQGAGTLAKPHARPDRLKECGSFCPNVVTKDLSEKLPTLLEYINLRFPDRPKRVTGRLEITI